MLSKRKDFWLVLCGTAAVEPCAAAVIAIPMSEKEKPCEQCIHLLSQNIHELTVLIRCCFAPVRLGRCVNLNVGYWSEYAIVPCLGC